MNVRNLKVGETVAVVSPEGRLTAVGPVVETPDHELDCGLIRVETSRGQWPMILGDRIKPINEYVDSQVAAAGRAIAHGCDGPVTPFVAIARSIELARKGSFPTIRTLTGDTDPIAEALFEFFGRPEDELNRALNSGEKATFTFRGVALTFKVEARTFVYMEDGSLTVVCYGLFTSNVPAEG